MKPQFTYQWYISLLRSLRENGYSLIPFRDAEKIEGPHAIIRHDIDVSLESAVPFAELEAREGISSTYFVLLSSRMYNLLDPRSEEKISQIIRLEHEIGLHFDITKYEGSGETIERIIIREIGTLESLFGSKVNSISWHIPQKSLLGKRIPELYAAGVKNAYDPSLFYEYKYLSDSMMEWRQNPHDFNDSGKYPRLQILTHPIWYSRSGGANRGDILRGEYRSKRDDDVRYLKAIYPQLDEI
jgi:hypothetical protein